VEPLKIGSSCTYQKARKGRIMEKTTGTIGGVAA
jgi:hypothetical protein